MQPADFSGDVKVYTIDDQQQRTGSISGTFSMFNAATDPHWLRVTLPQALQSGKSYQAAGTKIDGTVAFAPYAVDTKATATISFVDPQFDLNPCSNGLTHVALDSKIALQPESLAHAQILAQDEHGNGLPAFALQSVSLAIQDPSNIGSPRGCSAISANIRKTKHFSISSVKNIFGDVVKASGGYKAIQSSCR